MKGIWLTFNNKKNIKSKSPTFWNLSNKVNNTTFSRFKFPNNTIDYGNNKANY